MAARSKKFGTELPKGLCCTRRLPTHCSLVTKCALLAGILSEEDQAKRDARSKRYGNHIHENATRLTLDLMLILFAPQIHSSRISLIADYTGSDQSGSSPA
jgi:hypothetical protein